jgi:hypothetical protein
MGLSFSFNKKMAKIAANMGAIYRKDTAVPMGKYLKDKKNKLMEINPNKARIESNFRWFPSMGILFFKRKTVAKTKEVTDLKNTN